ncbi:MAG: T9SS type A sorting domain-containing protein [Flavobacteriales bacterium]|nr:T9SS type A sorting domain-containing protein [Flavobacteriales bacterium]
MMNSSTLRTFGPALLMGSCSLLSAQSPVDIGLHANNGQLEVHMRPSADFDGILSSTVFTLRWENSANIELGEPTQPNGPATYIPIAQSGAVRDAGTFSYMVFAGFGFEPIRNTGAAWEAGKEYTVLSIPFSGDAAVELVNDNWTNEVTNNADYYVSMGGQDATGAIYQKSITASEQDGAVTILPNPNDGQFMFSFLVATPSDLQVDVVNTLGQSIFTDAQRGFEGTYRKEMDIRTESNGIYYLKVSRNGDVGVHKIVYR